MGTQVRDRPPGFPSCPENLQAWISEEYTVRQASSRMAPWGALCRHHRISEATTL